MFRVGRNIKLIVREEEPGQKAKLYENFSMLPASYSHTIFNLDKDKSKLFVGGMTPSFVAPETLTSNFFNGSMELLMINDELVSFWNFVDAENNGSPTNERDKLLDTLSSTGYRFKGDGYVKLSKRLSLGDDQPDEIQFRVQFKFKTWSRNGLMYLMGGDSHFLALELKDGRIIYQVDSGDGHVEIKTPQR